MSMSKRGALFDTQEFNIDNELKLELATKKIEAPDNKSETTQVGTLTSKEKSPEVKPKYLRLALTEDSHKYLSLMAEQTNQSMTKYINMLIEKDKKKNKVLYDKLIEIENMKLEALKNI